MTSHRTTTLAILAITMLVACGPKADNGAATDTAAAAAHGASGGVAHTDSAGGMQGMSGMQGADSTGGMAGMPGMATGDMSGMPMQAHVQMMRAVSGDSMKAMLPMHRQMVANMLSRMTREMRQMKMPTDAAWTATVDSVRQDPVRLPELNAADLKAMMPAHTARVTRVAEMHQRMMQQMAPAPK